MENTAEAFRSSLRRGFSAIELDLVSLVDGEVVVFHDKTLSRQFSDLREPSELSFPEFRRINPHLLSFNEFVDEFASLDLQVNLEIKDGVTTLDRIEESICKFKAPVISSFNRDVVDAAIERDLPAAYLFHSREELLLNIETLAVNRIHINHHAILEGDSLDEILKECDIYCYTVNDLIILKKLALHYPVKGVFTDDPELPGNFLKNRE